MSATARRFSLAVETDPLPANDMSQPISACLIDNRPEISRHTLYESESHASELKPRRYLICDLNTLQYIPRCQVETGKPETQGEDETSKADECRRSSVSDQGRTATSDPNSPKLYYLASENNVWRSGHQRRNTTAIRFSLPKTADALKDE